MVSGVMMPTIRESVNSVHFPCKYKEIGALGCVLCYTRCERFGEGSVMAKRKRSKKQRAFGKRLAEGALMRLEQHAREKAEVEAEQNPALEVEFVRSRYQPTKAELEEDMRLPEDGGVVTLENLEEMGRALVQPVDVTWRDKPRKGDG